MALRQRRLERLVRFARAESAYYREALAALDDGDGIEIERLPVLEKATLRARRDEIRVAARAGVGARLAHTGGSTGKPLSFWIDDDKIERMRAGMMRGYRWCGWEPGEKILNFWGAQQDLKRGPGRRWRDFIAAERTVGAWEFGARELDAWVALIRSWRPVVLQGYASVLAEVARHVRRRGLLLPPLKGVYSTAEVLHDAQREVIESAFGCQVFNQYGSREVPNIALECRHHNLHVFSDLVWLESDPARRFLVTSLSDYQMPFIRYANGDSGRLKPGACPCGSPFPMIEMELCRANDILITPGGRRVYPSWFVHLLDGVAGVRQFQFHQQAADAICLRLVLDAPLDEAVARRLRQRVAAELGQHLRIEPVERIPRGASGKHRFVIAS